MSVPSSEPGWITAGALEWFVAPARTDGLVEGGQVVDIGYARTPVDQVGTLQMVAVALQEALARPVGSGIDQVLSVPVEVGLAADSMTLSWVGSAAVVAATQRRLWQVLADPSSLEVTDALRHKALALPIVLAGWGVELSARFGSGAFALGADLLPTTGSMTTEQLRAIVFGLRPGAGRTWTGFASDPAAVVSPTVVQVGPPVRLPLPSPNPETSLPGAVVTASAPEHLLSTCAGDSVADEVAVVLLMSLLHRRLVEFDKMVPSVIGQAQRFGSTTLMTVHAPEGFDAERTDVVRAIAEVVEDFEATHSGPIQEAVESVRASLNWSPLRWVKLRLDGGRQFTPATWYDELNSVSEENIRLAMRQLRMSALLTVATKNEAPQGFTVWNRELPPPSGPLFVTKMLRTDSGGQYGFRCSSTVLYQMRRHGFFDHAHPGNGVDLRHLALRKDLGDTLTVLVDEQLREVQISWPAVRRSAALRSKVDRATVSVPRVTTPPNEVLDKNVRSALAQYRKRKIGLCIVGLGLVLVITAVVMMIKANKQPDQPITEVTAQAAQQVSLANGSTVQVWDGQWRSVNGEPTLTAQAKFCGGGPTVADGSSADARNYIGPDKFTAEAGGRVVPSRLLLSDPLQPVTLTNGACTQGTLSFSFPAGIALQAIVRYSNTLGDNISWPAITD